MSNQTDKKDKSISSQQNLFDTELSAGSLEHLSLGVKQSLSNMLRPRDRYIVAAMISRATGIEVKGSVFEKILSSDPAYQPTVVQALACCQLTRQFDPFEFGLGEVGAGVLTAADMPLIRLARKRQELEKLEQECAMLEAQCKIRR